MTIGHLYMIGLSLRTLKPFDRPRGSRDPQVDRETGKANLDRTIWRDRQSATACQIRPIELCYVGEFNRFLNRLWPPSVSTEGRPTSSRGCIGVMTLHWSTRSTPAPPRPIWMIRVLKMRTRNLSTNDLDQAGRQALARQPIDRMRTMTDIVKGTVLLASDDAGFITGAGPRHRRWYHRAVTGAGRKTAVIACCAGHRSTKNITAIRRNNGVTTLPYRSLASRTGSPPMLLCRGHTGGPPQKGPSFVLRSRQPDLCLSHFDGME
jgi:hypothetical protein